MDDPLLSLKVILVIVQFILLIVPFYLSARLEAEEEKDFLAQNRAARKSF